MIAEKQCSRCKLILPVTEFYASKKNKCGLASQCKTCHKQWQKDNKDRRSAIRKKYDAKPNSKIKKQSWNESNKHRFKAYYSKYYALNKPKWANDRTVRKVQTSCATPDWADKQHIESVYAMAKWLSDVVGIKYHVDHVVPLRNKNVCGLHNQYNLSIRPAIDNLRKGNRTWPNMP